MTPTKLRTLIIGICTFAVAGLIFGATEETPNWDSALDGVLLGSVIGSLIMLLEVFVFPSSRLRSLRRLPLPVYFLIRLLSWLMVIFLIIDNFGPPRDDPEWAASIAISLVLTLVAVSFMMIQRIVGQSALINLLTGRYYRPKRGEFALLFIDLKGSTAIAEKIGNEQFFSFLNEFVTDACEPIRANGGEVHKYVGDEIIASWPSNENFDLEPCLQTWGDLVHLFETLAPSYGVKFGVEPTLRCAVHVGEVVIGQIGSYKQEIAMLGEPMNAAARLLELSGSRDVNFVASDAAIEKMKMASAFQVQSIGHKLLRGCKGELEVFSISEPPQHG